MRLSIIILTYNSSRHIEACLNSLKKNISKEIGEKKYELLIIDNNSQDSTVEILEKNSDLSFRLIKNNENSGFAAGINKAVEHATGDVVVLLNPDTEILDVDFEKILEEFGENSVGVVGGKSIQADGAAEFTAGKFYNLVNMVFFAVGLENILGVRFAPDKKAEVEYVAGGFMVIRRELFKRLSGFDEGIFMYVEDMEFCYRVRNAGYKTLYVPYAKIKHYGQGSSDRSFAIKSIYAGILFFFKKHKPAYQYAVVQSVLRLKAFAGILVGGLTFNKELVRTYKSALKAL